MPLSQFYGELVRTQQVLNMKHLGVRTLWNKAGVAACLLMRGQTNFLRMLWKFNGIYNADKQLADHDLPVHYRLTLPQGDRKGKDSASLYVLRTPERTAGA